LPGDACRLVCLKGSMTHGYYSYCCIPATASPKVRLSDW
jgi:hypothetical protein